MNDPSFSFSNPRNDKIHIVNPDRRKAFEYFQQAMAHPATILRTHADVDVDPFRTQFYESIVAICKDGPAQTAKLCKPVFTNVEHAFLRLEPPPTLGYSVYCEFLKRCVSVTNRGKIADLKIADLGELLGTHELKLEEAYEEALSANSKVDSEVFTKIVEAMLQKTLTTAEKANLHRENMTFKQFFEQFSSDCKVAPQPQIVSTQFRSEIDKQLTGFCLLPHAVAQTRQAIRCCRENGNVAQFSNGGESNSQFNICTNSVRKGCTFVFADETSDDTCGVQLCYACKLDTCMPAIAMLRLLEGQGGNLTAGLKQKVTFLQTQVADGIAKNSEFSADTVWVADVKLSQLLQNLTQL